MYNRTFLLIIGDAVLALLGSCAGFFIRGGELPEISGLLSPEPSGYVLRTYPVSSLVLFVGVMLFSAFFVELYNENRRLGKRDVFLRVMTGVIISFFVLSALYYMMPFAEFGRGVLAISIVIFGVFQFFWHISYGSLLNFFRLKQRVLILGTGLLAKQIGDIIRSTNGGREVIGHIECEPAPPVVPSESILGNNGNLVDITIKKKVDTIIVALSERRGIFPVKDVLKCKFNGVDIIDAPSFSEQLTGKLMVENANPSSFIFDPGFRITPYVKKVKRIIDILLSTAGLLISLPLMLIIAICIKMDSRGPVFFKQTRVGLGGKDFTLFKFRTMRNDAEEGTGAVWARTDDPRITRLGKFLREQRLDELPQLYNILKGDMSFIGPRPERPEFVSKLEEIIPYYSERHFVKPGLTGWAQVRYRYGDSVESAIEKLKYDLFYIKHISLFLEFQIFFETVRVIMFAQGSR